MYNFDQEYEKIVATDRLKERIDLIMKKEKRNSYAKNSFVSVGAAFIMFAVIINVFPSISYAMMNIPVLGSVVRVLTLDRFVQKDNGYSADIVTPKIEGLLDKELEDDLNANFKNYSDSLIAAFENDVKELKKEFGDETVHMAIESNYTVKTDNENILAIDNYTFSAAGSSNTIHSFYTIDKNSRELLTLSSLFKKESDYISSLSTYIINEMKRRNEQESGLFWTNENDPFGEAFDKIKPNQNFYINNDNQLVICFDKYEVAAGAQGSPEFIIPKSVIESIAEYPLLKS